MARNCIDNKEQNGSGSFALGNGSVPTFPPGVIEPNSVLSMYKFRSIPTEYRGIKFKSRQEARWAAFYDDHGWGWTYEPFDLEGWTPDFLLYGNAQPVLVEIKPIIVPTYSKMIEKIIWDLEDYFVILSGCGVFKPTGIDIPCIGWRYYPDPTNSRREFEPVALKEFPDQKMWAISEYNYDWKNKINDCPGVANPHKYFCYDYGRINREFNSNMTLNYYGWMR